MIDFFESLYNLIQKSEAVLSQISNFVWGWPLLLLLFGTHLFLTFRLGFIQRFIGLAIRISFDRGHKGKGDISQFGALMTALAATIGTGNIVGVATAVALGGPGAVLWMWLTGVFGIATKYTEAFLSIKFRVKNRKNEMSGGPMYVLEKGMKNRPLAVLFALFTAIAAFGIGNMVQSNSIATLAKETFHISPWMSGFIMTFFTGMVILGGIQSIARWCEYLVPFMAIFYVAGCLVILALNASSLGSALKTIVVTAFTGQAAVGGFVGVGFREAMRYGVARGLFSNESGLGSAPIVAAAARTKSAVRQALISSTGTFWDTVVVCALTGLVIVSSGEWAQGGNGALLTKAAFSDIPVIGPFILTIGLLIFVFSTILGWSYYGEKAVEYLLGTRAVWPYRWLWVFAVMVGAVATLPVVWTLADIANAIMAIPNLISLLTLHSLVAVETKRFFSNQKKRT